MIFLKLKRNDTFVLSKGHKLALYSTLFFPKLKLSKKSFSLEKIILVLCQCIIVKGVEFSTGTLGH